MHLPFITTLTVLQKVTRKISILFCRRELFQSDISIHTIEPGGFDTSICDGQKLANSLKMAYERAPEDLKPVYGGNISRFCKLDELP